MTKLKLALEMLDVESFATAPLPPQAVGTVRARESGDQEMVTNEPSCYPEQGTFLATCHYTTCIGESQSCPGATCQYSCGLNTTCE